MELPQANTQIPVCSYTRTELLSLRTKTSLFSLSTVDRLKDLNIGYHLPRRHRSSRGAKRKKQNLHSFIVASFNAQSVKGNDMARRRCEISTFTKPPPNRRNNLTDSMFTEQLPDLLDYVNNLPGFVCLVGDMNIHFDNPLQSLTKQTLTTLSLYNLVQVTNKPTHRCGHIIDWVIVRPEDDIHKKSTVTDSLESDHYCTKSYFNI